MVQATARDLLAYWILEMDSDGLEIVLHAHDEIICMLEEVSAEIELQDMLQIMCRGPEWSNGLPLDVEGGLSDVYKK